MTMRSAVKACEDFRQCISDRWQSVSLYLASWKIYLFNLCNGRHVRTWKRAFFLCSRLKHHHIAFVWAAVAIVVSVWMVIFGFHFHLQQYKVVGVSFALSCTKHVPLLLENMICCLVRLCSNTTHTVATMVRMLRYIFIFILFFSHLL